MARRREDRTIGCLLCGDVLAIYEEGGTVPTTTHVCTNAPADEAEALAQDVTTPNE